VVRDENLGTAGHTPTPVTRGKIDELGGVDMRRIVVLQRLAVALFPMRD